MKKDPAEERKAGWADFRAAVWHKSASKILQPLFTVARTGYRVECGDKKERNAVPILSTFAGDYEEQCVLACLRGRRHS